MIASERKDALRSLYQRWGQRRAANPDMSLKEWRDMVEEWGEVTSEPHGVDYFDANAGGVPAL
jgi:hypothetical protein